eukprot:8049431-Pyramimonas_sp.AAC.1
MAASQRANVSGLAASSAHWMDHGKRAHPARRHWHLPLPAGHASERHQTGTSSGTSVYLRRRGRG